MFKWLDSILFTLRVAWYAITKPPKRIEPKRPDPDDSVLRVRPLEGAIVFRPDGLEIVIPDLEACEELAVGADEAIDAMHIVNMIGFVTYAIEQPEWRRWYFEMVSELAKEEARPKLTLIRGGKIDEPEDPDDSEDTEGD